VDRKVARAYVVEHYPSKQEQARRMTQRVNNKRDASQPGNEGQPKGSANRAKRDRVPPPTISQFSLDDENYAECVEKRVENRWKTREGQSGSTSENDLDRP